MDTAWRTGERWQSIGLRSDDKIDLGNPPVWRSLTTQDGSGTGGERVTGIAAHGLRSLRAKLSFAAGAGLVSAVVLAGLLLLVTWNSAAVVTQARQAQDRVHTFNHLLKAVRDYHGASYVAVREPGPGSAESLAAAKQRFEGLIEEASRLEVNDLREREVRARITTQSRAALDQFRDAEGLVARVDRVWREQGSQAALAEVGRIIVPVKALETTLEREIRYGDIRLEAAVARAQQLNGTAVAVSVLFLLLAVAFLVAVQWLLYARLRPGLARLERGAQAIGAGRLDHRIGMTGRDELAALGQAFDAMAGEIASQQEKLHQTRRGLERAVTERTSELEAANAKLSAADERRRAFLADISHELRTPLTIIRGEAQVALRTADQPAFDPCEAFDHILAQTDHMRQMVSDLFLIARAEAGGLPLDLRVHDIRVMLAGIAADFENLAAEGGGSVRVNAAPRVVALVDLERLHRALTALVENAFEHCQQGVHISLEAEAGGGMVTIAVCDDGPGIDPDQADRLFERFCRGQKRGEGAGLGLSIVSALAEAHGGRARLAPRKGGGTRAIIELPAIEQESVAA
jgi:signal transduction histidine kinase